MLSLKSAKREVFEKMKEYLNAEKFTAVLKTGMELDDPNVQRIAAEYFWKMKQEILPMPQFRDYILDNPIASLFLMDSSV